MAEPVTIFLYGDKWIAAVQSAQILCIAFIIRSLTAFGGHCLLSMGEARLYFIAMGIIQIPNVILIIITSFISKEAVALSQIPFYLIVFVTFHFILNKRLNISIKDVAIASYKSFLILILTSSATGLTYLILKPINLNVPIEIGVTGAAWAIAYISGVFLFKHSIKDELTIRFISPSNRLLKITQEGSMKFHQPLVSVVMPAFQC